MAKDLGKHRSGKKWLNTTPLWGCAPGKRPAAKVGRWSRQESAAGAGSTWHRGNRRGTKVPILCHRVKASMLGMAFKLRGSNNPSEKELLAFLWLTPRQISDSTEISRVDFDLLSLNERMMPKGPESLSCCTLLKSMRQHHVIPAEDTAWFILFLGCKCGNSQCNGYFEILLHLL